MYSDRLAVRESPVELVRRIDEGLTGVRARESNTWVRVRPGVYAARSAWERLAPWERYVARVHAYALINPHAVFCLESAAALLGIPLFGEPRDIHVLLPGAPRSQRQGDVCGHSSHAPKALRPGQLVSTTWDETAVDLMRVLPPAFALAVGDACVRVGGATVGRLQDVASAQSTRRGIRQLEWLWPRIDPAAESVGESISRAVIEWCGFPRPHLQVRFVTDGFEDRVDFVWREFRIGGESDGYGKYLLEGASGALGAVKSEKRRENRLRRHLVALPRWDYADAMRAEPLRRTLAAAHLPQLHAPSPALLRTLARNPRSR